MIQSTTVTTATEHALVRELRTLGFVEGPPPHIAPALVSADVRIYRNLRCAECGHRGHKIQPMHRGREYRLLCSCRQCGNQCEA